MLRFSLAAAALASTAAQCTFSNIFGDHMVLQRDTKACVVNGFGKAGDTVTVSLDGAAAPPVTVDAGGIWRATLPSTPAGGPHVVSAACAAGGSATLNDVLFGDVFFHSGQSNMAFTTSMAFNSSVEIARANNGYGNIRVFNTGQYGTTSLTPLTQLGTIEQKWSLASSASVGGADWSHTSAVGWLFSRNIFDALGKKVPIGLVASNWGGTRIQAWSDNVTNKACNTGGPEDPTVNLDPVPAPKPVGAGPDANTATVLFNAMVYPYTIGPMALKGITWFQGESNGGEAAIYACSFPTMIKSWKTYFSPTKASADGPWFGFVVLEPWVGGCGGAFRDSQMAGMTVPNVGYGSASDIGDPQSPYVSYHPRAKQLPSARLAAAAMAQVYGMPQSWRMPAVASAVGAVNGASMTVTVTFAPFNGTLIIKTIPYQTACPTNEGVSAATCAWPSIMASNGRLLNATLTTDASATKLVFTAPAGGATPTGVQYAWGVWPVVTVYSSFTISTGYETFDFPLDGFNVKTTPAAAAKPF